MTNMEEDNKMAVYEPDPRVDVKSMTEAIHKQWMEKNMHASPRDWMDKYIEISQTLQEYNDSVSPPKKEIRTCNCNCNKRY